MRDALRLGYAGLLPFVAGAGLVWLVRPEVHPYVALALSGYAAVILSFLGGIHWGLAMREPTPPLPPVEEAPAVAPVQQAPAAPQPLVPRPAFGLERLPEAPAAAPSCTAGAAWPTPDRP